MKLRFFVIISLLLSALSLQAQKSEVGKLSVIPFVGINSSNISSNDAYNDAYYLVDEDANTLYAPVITSVIKSKGKIGLTAGVAAEYRYSLPLSTSVCVGYSRGGYRYTEGVRMRCHLDFLNLALLENLYIADGLALKAGVQFDYLMGGKYKYDEFPTEDISYDLFRRWNFVIPVGISYEYQRFMLDLRYNFGISDMNKILDGTQRSKGFVMSLGYRFHLN